MSGDGAALVGAPPVLVGPNPVMAWVRMDSIACVVVNTIDVVMSFVTRSCVTRPIPLVNVEVTIALVVIRLVTSMTVENVLVTVFVVTGVELERDEVGRAMEVVRV